MNQADDLCYDSTELMTINLGLEGVLAAAKCCCCCCCCFTINL